MSAIETLKEIHGVDVELSSTPGKVRVIGSVEEIEAARNFVLKNKPHLLYELYNEWLDSFDNSGTNHDRMLKAAIIKKKDQLEREILFNPFSYCLEENQ